MEYVISKSAPFNCARQSENKPIKPCIHDSFLGW